MRTTFSHARELVSSIDPDLLSHTHTPTTSYLADLISPECATGSMPYLYRWCIKSFVPVSIMLILYLVARCRLLKMQRVLIVISFIAQLTFIFGGLGCRLQSPHTHQPSNVVYLPYVAQHCFPTPTQPGMTAAMSTYACTEPSNTGLTEDVGYLVESPDIPWYQNFASVVYLLRPWLG